MDFNLANNTHYVNENADTNLSNNTNYVNENAVTNISNNSNCVNENNLDTSFANDANDANESSAIELGIIDKNYTNNTMRFFEYSIDGHNYSGRFEGSDPKIAASKAYTHHFQVCKRDNLDLPTTTQIYLRETTRGSTYEVFAYEDTRVKQ